ncbi:MAG: hypothetical protein LBJ31_10975 [Treponema sp.]|jgi:hypothetical protein|nr:hypothetical protein [Treponema sp.]
MLINKKLLSLVMVLAACGIENYIYLEPVTSASTSAGTTASFSTPGQSSPNFRYYTIFYRIYLSATNETAPAPVNYNAINPVLASHYNTLYPYTYADNSTPSSLGTVFANLNYYSLAVNNGSLYNLLNSASSFSVQLRFDEPSGTVDTKSPYLTINSGSTRYRLFRNESASDDFSSNPVYRYFYGANTPYSLYAPLPTANTNRDVQTAAGTLAYSYVSFYVVAQGIDDNYSPVYSRPTHIGVLRLPDF